MNLNEILALLAAMSLVLTAVGIFMIICMWKIYSKAGKPGWAAIVPIYNIVVLLEIVKKPVWWIILLLIPIVNLVVTIILINQLSKAFGQGVGFTLGLLFLGIIFYPVLAFGKYDYQYGQTDDAAILE